MKKLIFTLALALSFGILSGSVSAAFRYWKVEISEPTAQTTQRELNIAYNVQSTVKDDTFTVKLYENGLLKGSQDVDTDYGDSGVFNLEIPATGTYTYYVEATNNEAAESKESDKVTVEVENEPEPTVTVVTVAPAGGAGGAAAEEEGFQPVAAGAAGGEVAAGEDEGVVGGVETDESAADEQTGGQEDEGTVLGAEDAATNGNNKARNALFAGLLLAAVAAGSYGYRLKRNIDL